MNEKRTRMSNDRGEENWKWTKERGEENKKRSNERGEENEKWTSGRGEERAAEVVPKKFATKPPIAAPTNRITLHVCRSSDRNSDLATVALAVTVTVT